MPWTPVYLDYARMIPGEKFGVGGMWSVRGFEERALSGDSGWFASLEMLTPKLISELRGAAFIDLAAAQIFGTASTPRVNYNVGGTGLGLRYRHDDHLETRADIAQVIAGAPDTRNYFSGYPTSYSSGIMD